MTYFFTLDSELVAVDTFTGEILDSVEFQPRFPKDFDFANDAIIVAAEDNMVSLYFEDAQQLSIFQFNHQ